MADSAEHSESLDTVSVRGSFIGGGALADSQVVEQPYPFDIVASSEVEWIEWDLRALSSTIDVPGMATVQASFYHALYVQVLHKLETARGVRKKVKREQEDEIAPPPSSQQLLSLFTFVAVPFCGFGFADNAIMILCGDFIDAKFGMAFGLTTMAAAGLGNWVSDVVGLGLGDAIERGAEKIGLSNGGLTKAQENSQAAKLTSLMGKFVGISLGCLLGMFPLLFLKSKKTEFANEDLEIFDEIFRPNGVTTVQFVDLLERGTKRSASSGTMLVQGGQQNSRVFFLLRGEVAAFRHGEGAQSERHPSLARCIYYGKLVRKPLESQAHASAPVHGSIIGGAALGEPEKLARPYPNDVVAMTGVEWIDWDVEDLRRLMEEEKAIQASFYSILFGEILKTLRSDSGKQKTKHYQSLLAAVVADGVVSDEERQVLEEYKERLQINEQDHLSMLQELGWSKEAWEQGCRGGKQHADRRPQTSGDAAEQLEQAAFLIERVMLTLRGQGLH
jgi:CRP-like cAMP-binding protein